MADTYYIVRMYAGNKKSHKVRYMDGLTLEQAQEHCRSPETSWKTCKTPAKLRITAKYGAWFEGYEREK